MWETEIERECVENLFRISITLRDIIRNVKKNDYYLLVSFRCSQFVFGAVEIFLRNTFNHFGNQSSFLSASYQSKVIPFYLRIFESVQPVFSPLLSVCFTSHQFTRICIIISWRLCKWIHILCNIDLVTIIIIVNMMIVRFKSKCFIWNKKKVRYFFVHFPTFVYKMTVACLDTVDVKPVGLKAINMREE